MNTLKKILKSLSTEQYPIVFASSFVQILPALGITSI